MKAVKLPSGSYRVQAGKTVNGKFIRKSFTADTPQIAKRLALEWQTADEGISPNMLLCRAYKEYFEIKKNVLSPSTFRGYSTLYKTSFQDIMQFPISEISNVDIQRSVNAFAVNHSAKTVRNAVGLLKAVLKTFHPNLYIDITLPQKTHTDRYIPDDNDIRQLLSISKGTKLEIPILLAIFGTMRRGEICALTSDDVKGNIITINKSMCKCPDGSWQIKQPKTYSSYREVELPDFVVGKIKDIKGRLVEYTPNSVTEAFEKLLKNNNLPHFRFHDLRHYSVSAMHSINIPDKYIMQRGGWSTNYVMQSIYNHTLRNKEDEMQNKIDKHFTDIFS